MGDRGPGARPKSKNASGTPRRQRRPAWAKTGLTRLERVVAFLESLPITKGKLVGQKMRLTLDQRSFLERVYGETAAPVRIAVLSQPRGSGKTGLVAGLLLAHLTGPEAEPRGEVYCAAIDRGMAAKIFAEAEAIITAVPELDAACSCKQFAKEIKVVSGPGIGSVFQALSADARRGHGLAPSLWIYDELAQVPDGELLDNLTTAGGKRARSLGIVISTQATSDDHPLSRLIDDGLAGYDPGIVVHLTAAPPDADPFDPEVVRRANPGIAGGFLSEADVLADMMRAQRVPSLEPRYRNLRLNQRVDANQEDRLLPAGIWDACGGAVDRAALKGRPCFGGLDLSGKHDLTALVLVFPDDAPEPTFDVLAIAWTPAGQLAARPVGERELFEGWIKSGHLISVPGPTIRSGWISAEIGRLAAEFDVRAIAFDRWRIDDLRQDLADAGSEVRLEPRGQGFRDASPDLEMLAELAMTGRLRHGGHPVLRAAMSGAIVVRDPAGNMKLDKERGNRRQSVRIDAAIAAAMAIGAASRPVEKGQDWSLAFAIAV